MDVEYQTLMRLPTENTRPPGGTSLADGGDAKAKAIDPASLRIVLVDTSHPGNIGAAARAMKNMGLRNLALVRPREFPSEEATARASGADDVLEGAAVVQTLEEAIADYAIVVGTTSRPRTHYQIAYDVRE